MNKKLIWKRLLIGCAWVICLGGLVVLMGFIETKKADVVCKAVNVSIPGGQYFIDKQEVDHIIEAEGRSLIGRKIKNIDIQALEDRLKANPFIEFAKVYAEMDGVLQVEVSQRQPILRIMNHYDMDFYVDQHGLKIPLSQNFTARVLVANGFIEELFTNRVDSLHTRLAKDLFKTADYIRKDSLWDAQIAQMYVNANREIELIPRVGNQRILIGNADSLGKKLNNLQAFYKQVLPRVGWDTYRIINVKYTNQVIGIKNENIKADSAKTAGAATTGSDKMKKDTSQIKL
ncbi:cell division protein FtsQ [Mucilaginibacter oryzae]|uniref:Cell division protein FtsQ n=1 Tax=Mucilaginibacter oryzae TaxID=468058 RepID=A0A316HB23_9SPHI|nr:cell division protein FtsQ [Mucilaginibacter oryzae]PWK77688.1 cell division protein FtsQ [Mucilaginibacter oryzae]